MTIALQRRPDWLPRLVGLANDRRSLPYRYGENDCWCFARAAVEAVTGIVLLPEVEAPRSWMAAAKAMIARGYESVEDIMTDQLGPPLDDVAQSRPGDIVSFEQGGDRHLAVRLDDAALTPAEVGLDIIEAGRWKRAWRVG